MGVQGVSSFGSQSLAGLDQPTEASSWDLRYFFDVLQDFKRFLLIWSGLGVNSTCGVVLLTTNYFVQVFDRAELAQFVDSYFYLLLMKILNWKLLNGSSLL